MGNIKLFETKKVRTYWDEEKETWYFSVIDVIEILTDSSNPRDYWFKMKKRVKTEDGLELSTNCRQLKMEAQDGKMRQTDVADTKVLLRIIQSIPSPKAEPFKQWLAKVGYERMNKAVFFDRDGTINSDEGHYYVFRCDDLVINPGVTETMLELQKRGYLIIIISNQGGIAKGEYKKEDTEAFHVCLNIELAKQGIKLTELYYCPHHEKVTRCLCRKPLPLMIEKAMARFNIDPAQSWFVGDGQRDMEAATLAGVRGIKIEKNSNPGFILNQIL